MLNPNLKTSLQVDKRFEALVKQEMAEHQAIISSHHKEMQALRDALQMSMERFNALFEHSHKQAQQQTSDFSLAIATLREKISSHEKLFSDHKSVMLSLHADVHQLYEESVYKADLEKLKAELSFLLQQTTNSHLNAFQSCEQELKSVISSLKTEMNALRTELKERVGEQDKKMAGNFSVSKIDKEGVSKEIRVYEKTIFIIEKKIENIYTLIERINKRGEACHKPE